MSQLGRATNHCRNPSFEVNTTDWASNGRCTLNRIASESAYVGDYLGRVEITSVAGIGAAFVAGSAVTYPAVAGESFSSHIAVRAGNTPAVGAEVRLSVTFFTSGDAVISTHVSDWLALTSRVNWQSLNLFGVIAPASTAYYDFGVEFNEATTGVGDYIHIDGMDIRRDDEFDVYFDGDSGEGFTWSGTAHLSTSVRLAGSGLSTVIQEYESASVTVGWKVYKATATGERVADLTDYVLGGRIESNVDRAIRMTGTLLLEDASLISPIIDYIAIDMEVTPERSDVTTTYPINLFATKLPTTSLYWERVPGEFQLLDMSSVLADSALTDTIVYPVGTNFVDAAIALIEGENLEASIPPSTLVSTAELSYSIGENKLDVVNDLLQSAGYYAVWTVCRSGVHGVIVSFPYLDLDNTNPWNTYTPDMLLEPPTTRPVDTRIANTVIVKKETASDTPIEAIAINDDPASPISTVSLGRTIARVISDSSLVDVTRAQELADTLLQEGTSYYVAISLLVVPDRPPCTHTSLILSYHNALDVCYCGKYWIRTFGYDLSPGSAMTLEINRIRHLPHEEMAA